MCSNREYTDAWDRTTTDIADAEFALLTPWLSVTWNIICQYNNIKLPDNCPMAMSALGRDNQVAACGREQSGSFQLDYLTRLPYFVPMLF